MSIREGAAILSLWLAILPFGTLSGDAVLDWNALMLDAIRNDNTSPTISTRNLAILHTAIFDAVNSVEQSFQPYRFQLVLSGETSAEAAAVGAAKTVIGIVYPSFTARAQELYDTWRSSTTTGDAITRGLQLGENIGLLAVEARSDDGSNTEVPYVPSNNAGQWQRTPPFFRPPLTPQWRYVEPFCLSDIESFVPAAPPSLNSIEYANSLNEVKLIGGKGSNLRSTEQSLIAVFWSDFSYTAMPPGHWHEIAATIAAKKGNTLEENARLFALVSLAQADAAIVCWESKYRFNLWRPITAIQRADEDGNPLTEKDAGWDHFLTAPPFPSYTSGHSSFSKASANVLTRFYGTDTIAFSVTSDSVPGTVRQFTSLSACADEVGMSRIYGGIHFQFDNIEGKKSGGRIADYVVSNYLLPNAQLPSLRFTGFEGGSPIVTLQGIIGKTYRVEASTNCARWSPVSTNIAVIGGVPITASSMAGTKMGFFRASEIVP